MFFAYLKNRNKIKCQYSTRKNIVGHLKISLRLIRCIIVYFITMTLQS